mmetsp:Transcript_57375/g.100822  ORF Transcript_57375/g.100822 Transcript_57375/m.100822 type:complete len:248 (-) Transcript_57375:139-882(-)
MWMYEYIEQKDVRAIIRSKKLLRSSSTTKHNLFLLTFLHHDLCIIWLIKQKCLGAHLHDVVTASLTAVYKLVRRQCGRGSHPTHIIRHRAAQFAQILLMVGFGDVKIPSAGNNGQHVRNTRETKHSENGFRLHELGLGVYQNGRLIISAVAGRKAALFQKILENFVVVYDGGIKNDSNRLHMVFLILKGGVRVFTTTVSDNHINNSVQVAEEIVGLPESPHTEIGNLQVTVHRRIHQLRAQYLHDSL